MASGMCFKFDASHHALMVFLVLEATVVFIITRVPLLKLQWQGRLFWSFGAFEPRCLQQQCLRKNYNFGTATSYHDTMA